jgi:hypothetical protein
MRGENGSIKERPNPESELGGNGSTDGSVGMVWEGRTGKAYEAACDVDAERTALLAQIDVVEEWEGIQTDTARVIV